MCAPMFVSYMHTQGPGWFLAALLDWKTIAMLKPIFIQTFYIWSNDFGHSFTLLILLVSCFKEAFGTDYIEMFKWLQIKSEPE